jgi:thiol-disulfide isomerase/thioredoxin
MKKLLALGVIVSVVLGVVVFGRWVRTPELHSLPANIPPALLQQENTSLFIPDSVALQDVNTLKTKSYFGKQPDIKYLGVVHYWATWCEPCEKELPEFIKLTEKFPDVTFYAISLDDSLSEVQDFLKKKLKWIPSSNLLFLFDSTGESAMKWGSLKLPETYVLSPKGVVFDKFEGPQAWLKPLYLNYFDRLSRAFN